jgi:prepilin peptidase CpaA
MQGQIDTGVDSHLHIHGQQIGPDAIDKAQAGQQHDRQDKCKFQPGRGASIVSKAAAIHAAVNGETGAALTCPAACRYGIKRKAGIRAWLAMVEGMGMPLDLIGMAILAIALLVAAGFDLWRFEIPDMVTIVVIAGAGIWALGRPDVSLADHLAAGGLVFGLGNVAFRRGWLGGGDVKLLSGCACWATLETLMAQAVLISLAGGVLALVLWCLRQGAMLAGQNRAAAPRCLRAGEPLPYAVAIAAGMAIWVMGGSVFRAAA